MRREQQNKDTSWKESSSWYDSIVGEKGHYYHQELIFPKLLGLLQLQKDSSILDLGCGQGVFSRQIPDLTSYTGIDFAKPLIERAKGYIKKQPSTLQKTRRFLHHDLTKNNWPLQEKETFSHIISILALQNMQDPGAVIKTAAQFLAPGGIFAIVLNHPCFRIPRKSRWGFDEATKTQTREMFSYLSPQEIPITTHPGKEAHGKPSDTTWSYHFPFSTWSSIISKAGLCITSIEEWVSPKVSTGKNAKRENRARSEFPLFLTFIMQKK